MWVVEVEAVAGVEGETEVEVELEAEAGVLEKGSRKRECFRVGGEEMVMKFLLTGARFRPRKASRELVIAAE